MGDLLAADSGWGEGIYTLGHAESSLLWIIDVVTQPCEVSWTP